MLHASISMLISRCFIVCFVVFESVQCAPACASTASMFASNQTTCQRKKTSPDENRCSSPVKPTTTPHTRLARAFRSSLKITSASFARRFVLDGRWWSRDLFQKWQTLSRFFLDLSMNVELIFCGSTLKTLLFKKFRGEIQFFTSELVRRSSKLPFEPRHDWSLRSRIREEYVRQCWCWGSQSS